MIFELFYGIEPYGPTAKDRIPRSSLSHYLKRREKIFENDKDREIFLEILGSVVKRYNFLCHAYCLIDNHYYLLIETPDGNLS